MYEWKTSQAVDPAGRKEMSKILSIFFTRCSQLVGKFRLNISKLFDKKANLMKKQISKWIINLILWVGFLLLFYLDLTGLSLHQWLGVAIGALVIVHFLQHVLWVKTTLAKFDSLPVRMRLNLLVDSAILLGMVLTVVSGVVMSTWLNLTLANYETWRILHIAFSVETLLVLLVKLVLHWKMIVLRLRCVFGRGSVLQSKPLVVAAQSVPANAQTPAVKSISRRDFLTMAGTATLVTTLTIAHVLKQETLSAQASSTIQMVAQTSDPTLTVTTTQPVTQAAVVEPTATAVQPTVTQAVSSNTCIVRCRNGCSFPGRCCRYTDSNGNNKCDLGECV
jgi:hypothetical protein